MFLVLIAMGCFSVWQRERESFLLRVVRYPFLRENKPTILMIAMGSLSW